MAQWKTIVVIGVSEVFIVVVGGGGKHMSSQVVGRLLLKTIFVKHMFSPVLRMCVGKCVLSYVCRRLLYKQIESGCWATTEINVFASASQVFVELSACVAGVC